MYCVDDEHDEQSNSNQRRRRAQKGSVNIDRRRYLASAIPIAQ